MTVSAIPCRVLLSIDGVMYPCVLADVEISHTTSASARALLIIEEKIQTAINNKMNSGINSEINSEIKKDAPQKVRLFPLQPEIFGMFELFGVLQISSSDLANSQNPTSVSNEKVPYHVVLDTQQNITIPTLQRLS